ncbi:MAG: hypothetical protein ACKO6D_06105, partial [Rubrivivax sp.]
MVAAWSPAHASCSFVSGSILAQQSSSSTLRRVQICAAGSPAPGLAQPSIDLGLPLAVLALMCGLLALLLGGTYRLACRIVPRW